MTAAASEDVDGVAVGDLGLLHIVYTLSPQACCAARHRAVIEPFAVCLLFPQIETVKRIYQEFCVIRPVCFMIIL